MNLKADGPDCKMVFKFGSRVERLHSARKQGIRLYKCYFALQNACWAVPKPLVFCIRWM